MRTLTPSRLLVTSIIVLAAAVTTLPAGAADPQQPLFDRFSLRLEGSWVDLKTDIRLDSELLGRGTTLSFEDDLNLDSGKTIPTLSFEWQIAKKHKLGVRWQDINRDSTAQALTEIQWGDEIIPIDANISLGFDITQAFIDYAYYPWVKEKWAAGFGLGIRWLDLFTELRWEEQTIGEGGDSVDASAPLPYLYFEYRRLLSDRWRMITGLGWLQITIGDISGGQYIGRASFEYLIGKRWSVGGALNLAAIDVEADAVDGRALAEALAQELGVEPACAGDVGDQRQAAAGVVDQGCA